MAARIQSSDIDIRIERLVEADVGLVSAFTCGNPELDHFFHNELFICADNHYLSAYCAKGMGGELLTIFTLANDSIVLSDYEDEDDFIVEASCRINESYVDNTNEVKRFYTKRYFVRLASSDEGNPTVRMYFTLDLLR